MKRFVNRRRDVVEDMINGYLAVYPKHFVKVHGKNQKINGFIRQQCTDKVSVVTGGGQETSRGVSDMWAKGWLTER